jgi:sterol desaturase/sphingolipid hydroxylase (fatty acid hydroxylase superfamily)
VTEKLIGLLVGLVALFVLFGLVERFWPGVRGQRRWRRGVKTDLGWFFFDPIISKPLAFVGVVLLVVAFAAAAGVPLNKESIRQFMNRDTVISAQPVWLQAVEMLVLLDVISYWSHRAFHRLGLLWRYHAVHHSSTQVDWLSSVRVHPLNEMGQRLAQALPLILLGYSPTMLAAYVPLLTLYAIGLHANVPWSFGPLRYVISSPVCHRWHHTTEQEGLDRNFAGMFPWVDALFGTLYMPRDRQPALFGILGDQVPDGMWGQLIYPFRRKRPAEVTGERGRGDSGSGLAAGGPSISQGLSSGCTRARYRVGPSAPRWCAGRSSRRARRGSRSRKCARLGPRPRSQRDRHPRSAMPVPGRGTPRC